LEVDESMRQANKFSLIAFVWLLFGSLLLFSSQEVTLSAGTRISLQLDDHLSTKLNNEGDTFTARVIAPIYIGDRLIIPKGSIVSGSISRIIRPGRVRGKAVMNLLFISLRIPGRNDISITASLARVDPEGNGGVQPEGGIQGASSAGRDSARVLTPGLAGAGIGGIIGGGKGAAVGAGVGAAVGLGTIFATRGKDIEMKRGTNFDIALDRPLTIAAE
jgi:hypothetical protein